jgi:alkanesulfonate monooxygenase SsuD/methylene tetrahydromethanopterin reductase-like flavin-dependent oxidoreductase (luciferase family)
LRNLFFSADVNLIFTMQAPNTSGGFVASKIPSTTTWTPEYNAKLAQIAESRGFEYALTLVRFTASHAGEYQHESVTFSQYLLSKTEKLKVIAAILPGPWSVSSLLSFHFL